MQLQIWRSFACNNSSAYRIIARFETEERAREAARDLQAFFDEASPLAQGRPKTTMKEVKTKSFPATDKIDALAQKHDFDWSALLITGVYDDELELIIEGTTLIAFHPYCLGLGSDLPKYFTAMGATKVEPGSAMPPTISVRFRWPEDKTVARSLRETLTNIFAQAETHESLRSWDLRPPWWNDSEPLTSSSMATALFTDDTRAGFYLPIWPNQLPALKQFLAANQVQDPTLRICEYADLCTFLTIAKARCNHCDSKPSLQLVDKDEHGLDTDQLACTTCGGMFALDQVAQERDHRRETQREEKNVL